MNTSIESFLFEPNSEPYGIPISEWIVRWWCWLLSSTSDKNPVSDESGKYSGLRQNNHNVWFLAGTFGGSVTRTCKIPSGKSILLPIINYECSFADEPLIKTEKELEVKCKSEIDDIKHLNLTIDQLVLSDLTRYRVRSPIFSIYLQEGNIIGAKSGLTRMITDGFWIFFKPLKIGKHIISSFGSCRSGKIKIQTTYNINVV